MDLGLGFLARHVLPEQPLVDRFGTKQPDQAINHTLFMVLEGG